MLTSLSCSQDTIEAEESTGGKGHWHCWAAEECGPQRVREIRPNVRHHWLPRPAAGHRAAEEGESWRKWKTGNALLSPSVSSSVFVSVDIVLNDVVVVDRKWNVETESLMKTWPDWWPTCRRGWSGQRSGHVYWLLENQSFIVTPNTSNCNTKFIFLSVWW